MNCKQGDLAVFVRSEAGNLGRIVRCVRYVGLRRWISGSGSVEDAPTWEIDQVVENTEGQSFNEAPDDMLRPIRDPGDDAVDEVIQRIGTPHKEVA